LRPSEEMNSHAFCVLRERWLRCGADVGRVQRRGLEDRALGAETLSASTVGAGTRYANIRHVQTVGRQRGFGANGWCFHRLVEKGSPAWTTRLWAEAQNGCEQLTVG